MRTWGAVVYEAHTCADYGSWLEGRAAREAAALLARAREVYQQIGARRWLESLGSRTTPTG